MMKRNLVGFAILASFISLCPTSTTVHGQMGGAGMVGRGGGGIGGMGGMGGMGGWSTKTPMEMLLEEIAKKPVEMWSRPTGEEPAWLSNGKSSVDATEELRAKLNQMIEVKTTGDFEATKALVKEKLNLEFEVNFQALDQESVDVANLPGLPVGTGPLREQLRRELDPLNLTYRVCEGYIEITSKNDAIDKPSTRFYDLSYVVRDSSRLAEILNAIYTSVEPDTWDQNGGNGTCVPVGQILVVRTSERNHLEIERLLARLSISQPPLADK